MNNSKPQIENVFHTTEVAAFVVELFILCVSTYVFVALAVLLYRRSRTSEIEKRSFYSCALLIVFVSFGLTVEAKSVVGVVTFALRRSTERCHIIAVTHHVSNIFGCGLLYVFLWMRQHTLYRNVHFKRLATKFVRRFSYSLLVVIFVLGVFAMIGTYFTSLHSSVGLKGQQCVYSKDKHPADYLIAAAYAAAFFVQVGILGLFVYILRQHQTFSHHVITSALRSNLSALERLRVVVRKYFISASVCVATDLVCVAITTVLRQHVTVMIISAMWDFDSLINFICALVCFNNWQEMLTTCRKETNKKTEIVKQNSVSVISMK